MHVYSKNRDWVIFFFFYCVFFSTHLFLTSSLIMRLHIKVQLHTNVLFCSFEGFWFILVTQIYWFCSTKGSVYSFFDPLCSTKWVFLSILNESLFLNKWVEWMILSRSRTISNLLVKSSPKMSSFVINYLVIVVLTLYDVLFSVKHKRSWIMTIYVTYYSL